MCWDNEEVMSLLGKGLKLEKEKTFYRKPVYEVVLNKGVANHWNYETL